MPHAVRPIALRGTLVVLLILGIFAMSASPAMAISGSSSLGSAAEAEYPPPKRADTISGPTTGGGNANGEGIPFSGFATLMLAGMGLLTLSGGLALFRAARTVE